MNEPLPADERQQADMIALLRDPNFTMSGGSEFAMDIVAALALRAPVEDDLLQDLCDRLKLEAQCHAQEARTANHTIAEIYQLVTGATGEPGNWHGAEPVRAYIAEQRQVMEQALRVLDEATDYVNSPIFSPSMERDCKDAIAALRARLGGQTGSDGVTTVEPSASVPLLGGER